MTTGSHRASAFSALFLGFALALLTSHPAFLLQAGEPDQPITGADLESHPLSVLHQNCLRCHTEEKRKGGLLLTSRAALLEGGDSGPVVILGNGSQSYLTHGLHRDAEDHMPPKSQLAPSEIIAIEEWIDSGVPWDDVLWKKLQTEAPTRAVDLASLPSGYQPVLALALSPDGRNLAAARGADVELYDVTDAAAPKLKATLSAHKDAVQSIAWSPDGKSLASGGFRAVHLWNPSRPAEPGATFTRNLRGRITALIFAANQTLVLADSTPGAPSHIYSLSLKDGAVAPKGGGKIQTAHEDSIFALALSPNGKLLASASADKLVKIWDANTLKPRSTLEGHTGYVLACAFSPGSDRIATGGDDEAIKVWRLETGEEISSFGPRINPGPVTALAWSADPDKVKKKADEKDKEKAGAINTDRILATYESGAPRIWTDLVVHEGAQRSTGAKERALSDPAQPIASLALDPDSLAFFTGSTTGELRANDPAGKLLTLIEGNPVIADSSAPVK